MMDLNGTWSLGFCDDAVLPRQELTRAAQLKDIPVIDAAVPGNFELDMEKAGLLPDLFVGRNLLKAQELEMTHLFYSRNFFLENLEQYPDPYFDFQGIDTFAEIYLNGQKIGSTDNMLIAHEIPAAGLRQGENELFIHITPVAIRAREYPYTLAAFGQKYNYDNTQARKSNYMAGWDIFPRIMSGGLWRGVSLKNRESLRFAQSYLFTNRLSEDLKSAELVLYYDLELGREPYRDFRIRVEGHCGDSSFCREDRVWSRSGRLNLEIENPRLWWPRGSGEQNLYDVTVTLLKNGETVEEKKLRTGIRMVQLDRTSTTNEKGEGEFCFRVNYRRIFILGTNWVPLDSFPSQGEAKVEKALALVEDIGCNMLRVWGGGYYESDHFFDLCDEKGFLVWQDFMMGCAMYPQDTDFRRRVELEATQVVRRFRQHPSLALWAGDNECDCACEWAGSHCDPNDNAITRQLLPAVIRANDYLRPFLPSSPYMDSRAILEGTQYITENHLWGPRDYFKSEFYQTALAHFASETGYHGCPSPESVKKFIMPEALWPWNENGEWLLHASSPTESMDEPYAFRIQLMASQISVLFGEDPDSLEEFSLLSQISQAEAMKFFIERFRIGKWRRTGIIWWNILDGCPQFSDAVVDYYFHKKLAYYYIKASQQQLCMMCAEPEDGKVRLYCVNDSQEDLPVSYRVTDLLSGRTLAEGSFLSYADCAETAAFLPESAEQTVWQISWESGRRTGTNHYACGQVPFDRDCYVELMKKAGYRMETC